MRRGRNTVASAPGGVGARPLRPPADPQRRAAPRGALRPLPRSSPFLLRKRRPDPMKVDTFGGGVRRREEEQLSWSQRGGGGDSLTKPSTKLLVLEI